MRIQHNIMAMNAYRNYNTNASALSKNLEKLSSGYKINRAGDDAAGLAISEKMRAQITGLDAATKNVKDGISLVQTAEGAMQEIQDMLNRMDYLATQSANGTYDNEVDRANLQKEVTALCDEIDRIADSANFNGIKLLDGSLDKDQLTSMGDFKDGQAIEMKGFDNTGDPIYHKDARGEAKTSFTVDFSYVDHLNYKVDDAGAETMQLRFSSYQGDNVLTTNGTDAAEVTLDAGSEVTGKSLATAVYGQFTGGKATITLGTGTAIEYEVKDNGDGTLTFTMTDAGHKAASDAYNAAKAAGSDADPKADDMDVFRGGFDVNFYDNAANPNPTQTGLAAKLADTNGGPQNSTTVVTEGSATAVDQLYDGKFKFDGIEVKDGSGLQIGDEYYVFATTKETLSKDFGNSNVKVVDLTDLDSTKFSNQYNKDGTVSDGANGDTTMMTEIFTRLSVAAKDNEMFSVGISGDNNSMEIVEKRTYDGDADLTCKEGVDKVLRTFSGIEVNEAGEALTLQIGDTADDYNKLKVNINDMHVAALGIGDIDISTQDGAAAAIDKIKAAINSVSSTRGDLGAIQNRLEHTSNNLSVMKENITDAESTIRDTDIAEEMTAYTKNNILLQSAQAMLAQANQVPQGVLQLLG